MPEKTDIANNKSDKTDKQVIECSRCRRLHEIDAAKADKPFTCDCGNKIDPATAAAPTEKKAASPDTSEAASRGLRRFLNPAALRGGAVKFLTNWKAVSATAAALALLVSLIFFVRGPNWALGHIELNGKGAPVGNGVNSDPDVHLRTLEDNSRAADHAAAAGALSQKLNDPRIERRLLEMLARSDLTARPLVVRLLGQVGTDKSLPTLDEISQGADAVISHLAISSITEIGTPLAESILRRQMTAPVRARDLLPHIAGVRNDTAARVTGSCLSDPALQQQALNEIARVRLVKCVSQLSVLAGDRFGQETVRLRSIEVLGQLNTPESRRVLIALFEDTAVGWKARQVLDQRTERH